MEKIGENSYQVDSVEAKRVFDEYRSAILPLYEIALEYWNLDNEEHLSVSKIEQVLYSEYGDSAYELLVIMNNAFAKINRLQSLERQDFTIYCVSIAETPQSLFYLVSKIIEKQKIEQENRTLKEAISLMAKEREEANK